MKGIIDFLLEAKKETYAGKGSETPPSRPQSHDLAFQKGNLKYLDTYLGTKKFAGEEALWEDGKPVWALNYAGRVLADGFSGDFLKEALLHVPEDKPFRGPETYRRDGFTYKCTVDGDFQWFSGYEEIWNGADKVYECRFHGGLIQ
ncbi:XRE family transcriptional regulator [Paenibacillus riograndensis]|uniref:XRE family transcriptional regulator n=1 Tax=Paenibacillus riograndensis TaxID=483937 RepID=A0A132U8X1_9BACL|nr:DUF5680 domain-containing protein [Paenibacillus riograndensis]KWX79803.1 XRE family transcriptional regulator [Paenibacillus riograndensis]